jgi:hypothetical protein
MYCSVMGTQYTVQCDTQTSSYKIDVLSPAATCMHSLCEVIYDSLSYSHHYTLCYCMHMYSANVVDTLLMCPYLLIEWSVSTLANYVCKCYRPAGLNSSHNEYSHDTHKKKYREIDDFSTHVCTARRSGLRTVVYGTKRCEIDSSRLHERQRYFYTTI